MNNDIFDKLETAWNDRDLEKVLSYYAEDGVYEDVALGEVCRGRDEIRKFYTFAMQVNPDLHVKYKSRSVNENFGAAEANFSATWSGEIEGVVATGKKFVISAATCVYMKDGKLTKVTDYWDYKSLLSQLGVEELRIAESRQMVPA